MAQKLQFWYLPTMRQTAFSLVEIEVDGVVHVGQYWKHNGMITVSNGEQQKTTQIGGHPPDLLAKMLLREIVKPRD
jgi:hypothetical protein